MELVKQAGIRLIWTITSGPGKVKQQWFARSPSPFLDTLKDPILFCPGICDRAHSHEVTS
jgi:hypothetical protein